MNIPSFWNYANPHRAASKLSGWFVEKGYDAECYIAPSGNAVVKMTDFDWTLDYAYNGANDSPYGWLVEPYDEHELIFVEETA